MNSDLRTKEIAGRLAEVRGEIAQLAPDREITLIVVTKNFPATDVQTLYDLGERHFGENRNEEGQEKAALLPSDVIWHFQGQIQSRKIPSILSWADVIHSLDEISHAEKISRLAPHTATFIQVSLDSSEERNGRGGVDPIQLNDFIEAVNALPLDLQGLMAVAPLASALGSEAQIDNEFARLEEIYLNAKQRYPRLRYLSAGMSGDYRFALAHGATHIRIGSQILGSRHLPH